LKLETGVYFNFIKLTCGLDAISMVYSAAGVGRLPSTPVLIGDDQRRSSGLVCGLLETLLYSPAMRCRESSVETLREMAENGGGSSEEENKESLAAVAAAVASSVPFWRFNIDSLDCIDRGKDADIAETALELCKERPRDSSWRLSSSDGRGVLSFVEVEDARSCWYVALDLSEESKEKLLV
jgi:hypothetical protein